MKLVFLFLTSCVISTSSSIKFSDVRSYLRKKARKFYVEKELEPPAKKFLISSDTTERKNKDNLTETRKDDVNEDSFARAFVFDDSSDFEKPDFKADKNSTGLTTNAILAIFDMIDPVSENFFENINSPWLRSGGGPKADNGIKKEMMTMLKEFIRAEYRKNPSSFPPPTLRNSAQTYFNINDVYNYACYCNFGARWADGRGKPKNVIDEACFDLYSCYTCVVKDLKSENESEAEKCEPGLESYMIPTKTMSVDLGQLGACQEVNGQGNHCKSHTCACEMKFINKIIQFYIDQMLFDPTLKHSLGFDKGNDCPTCQGDLCDRNQRECCGEYPERFLYKPSLNKGCCGSKVYDSAFMQCCEDGSVAAQC